MRRVSEPHRKAIGEEINRLTEANFIREIKQATWVANPVLVPKKNTKILRMCVDFTSLNKHCPKDHFPLPRIDQIVDSTSGCQRLSFLDAYSGYQQILMKVEDEELTAFITPFGIYCYTVMPFGLKNAGATYQRMMQNCQAQIGRNIQVYVDDIVIMTKDDSTFLDDLRETFDNLDRYRIKLNPLKCMFGVPSGQLLGYLISARGKSRENQGHNHHGEAEESQRCAETDGKISSPQQIHRKVRREGSPVLSAPEEKQQIRVDERGTSRFRGPQAHAFDSTTPRDSNGK